MTEGKETFEYINAVKEQQLAGSRMAEKWPYSNVGENIRTMEEIVRTGLSDKTEEWKSRI